MMHPFAVGATPAGSSGGSSLLPSIRTVSANTTLGPADYAVRVDTTSGNITITLPTGSAYQGVIYQIKKIAAANTLTVSSAQNIDGHSSLTLTAANAALEVQYDYASTSWNIL